VYKYCKIFSCIDEGALMSSDLERVKRAISILDRARTDPVVRGTASLEYVEDRLARGKVLLKRLEAKGGKEKLE
jgi:hypothetical protein